MSTDKSNQLSLQETGKATIHVHVYTTEYIQVHVLSYTTISIV